MAIEDLAEHSLRRNRQTVLLATAVFVLAFTWLDFVGEERSGWTILVRVVWAAVFVACAFVARVGSRRALQVSSYALAILSPLAFMVIAWFTGGMHSALYAWLVATPLCAALLVSDEPGAVTLAGLLSTAAALAILLQSGHGPVKAVLWAGSCGCSSIMGIYFSIRLRIHRESGFQALASHRRATQELAESERRRLHAERLATVGTLAAGVAHEINNPLSFVRSDLSCLGRAYSGEESLSLEEQREIVAECLVGVDRIKQIVGDLRTFARADEGTSAPVEVRAAVEEAVRIASLRLRGVARVETHVADELPLVSGPHTRLVQALTNLLVNAGDAIAESGAEPLVRVEAERIGDTVCLAVEDHGPGIPDRVRQHLFEPFVTTKPPGHGTGLGLPLTRECVHRLGGDIRLVDPVSGGTRFEIVLPVAEAA